MAELPKLHDYVGLMKRIVAGCLASFGLTVVSGIAWAGEVPLVGPAPDWVTPAVGVDLSAMAGGKTLIPIFDQQTLIDGDKSVGYLETAVTIGNQAQLNQFGTIQIPWRPQHGDLTFHKVEIVRGGERIDLLKSGSGFTVLRREAGLERLSIDGQLTAMMPVQGLRIGDVLHFALSISTRDEALGGRAQQAQLLIAKPVTVGFGRARLLWPKGQKLAWKSLSPGVTPELSELPGGMQQLTTSLPIAKASELPKNIPLRFVPVPMIEASSFADWQDVAGVMAPHYQTDNAIGDGSDLAALVDRIKASEPDPLRRAAAALRVVQDDVRYQLVALGNGNYVPQAPAETWSLRFGDCKAKTLLLLAMLRRMGIEAEPVLASSNLGDLVPNRLPSALAFDHVLVRAEIGGESIWLDGTRLGDRFADIRNVPRFGSVLPIRTSRAELIKLPARADARPATDIVITYDASAGIHMPVAFTLRETLSGYRAEQKRGEIEGGSADALVEFAKKESQRLVDSTTILDPKASYDKEAATWTLEVSGLTYPEWEYESGRWSIAYGPTLPVDFKPDRSKSIWRQIPALIDNPWTARSSWTLNLPEPARDAVVEGADPVSLDLSAVTYRRNSQHDGLVVASTENSAETGAEIAPAEIGAAKKAVEEASGHKLRVLAPESYPMRWDEVTALVKAGSPALKRIRGVFDSRIAADPKDAERYSDRAWLAERLFEWRAAEADRTMAISLDPTSENYVARAKLHSDLANHEAALADASKAYEIDSGNKEAITQLAEALGKTGKTDEALDLLDPSPDPASDEGAQSIIDRTLILADGGRMSEAIDELDKAIERRPSLAWFLNGRCWLRALGNLDLDRAKADCDKAIELASDPALYYDSRAMVHFRAGRLAEAKADLDAALAISPEQASSHFMRGVIAARQGDKAAANRDLAVALKLFPGVDEYFSRWGIKP